MYFQATEVVVDGVYGVNGVDDIGKKDEDDDMKVDDADVLELNLR